MVKTEAGVPQSLELIHTNSPFCFCVFLTCWELLVLEGKSSYFQWGILYHEEKVWTWLQD